MFRLWLYCITVQCKHYWHFGWKIFRVQCIGLGISPCLCGITGMFSKHYTHTVYSICLLLWGQCHPWWEALSWSTILRLYLYSSVLTWLKVFGKEVLGRQLFWNSVLGCSVLLGCFEMPLHLFQGAAVLREVQSECVAFTLETASKWVSSVVPTEATHSVWWMQSDRGYCGWALCMFHEPKNV